MFFVGVAGKHSRMKSDIALLLRFLNQQNTSILGKTQYFGGVISHSSGILLFCLSQLPPPLFPDIFFLAVALLWHFIHC